MEQRNGQEEEENRREREEDRRIRNKRAGEGGQEIMPGGDDQEGRKRGHKKITEGGSKEEGTRGR